ncbi:SET domain-containing protein [Peniophora sp. CONT]|nr:SET domain-containing protein [Peniophora sp. CONT]
MVSGSAAEELELARVACSSLIIVATRRARPTRSSSWSASHGLVLTLMADQAALRWTHLLTWLESRGMQTDEDHLRVYPQERPGAGNGLYATSRIEPNAPLFTIPARAKLNAHTLRPMYPNVELSAVQLISMHLCLHRPREEKDSTNALFGPYIDVLPREFESHPLTWSVKRKVQANDNRDLIEYNLLDMLPPSADAALRQIESRFWDDWKAVEGSSYLRDVLGKGHDLPAVKFDFLWGWLNVNTRCLYDDLNLGREDNISLCPIFDFANHVYTGATMRPETNASPFKSSSTLRDMTCTTLDQAVHPGQELFLTYGSHANVRLFVEYGFVNPVSAQEYAEYPGEILIDDVEEAILQQSAKDAPTDLSRWRDELEEQGYWLDWTLHSAPAPAHPSYRLLTALRLAHVLISKHGTISDWRDTLTGERELVSVENERAVRGTLREICTALISRAEDAVEALEEVRLRAGREKEGWRVWAAGNVKALWAEEKAVAEAVAESVDAGVDF